MADEIDVDRRVGGLSGDPGINLVEGEVLGEGADKRRRGARPGEPKRDVEPEPGDERVELGLELEDLRAVLRDLFRERVQAQRLCEHVVGAFAERGVLIGGQRPAPLERGKQGGLDGGIGVEHLQSLIDGGKVLLELRPDGGGVGFFKDAVLQGQVGDFDDAAPLQGFKNGFAVFFQRAYADALHLQHRHETDASFFMKLGRGIRSARRESGDGPRPPLHPRWRAAKRFPS